MGDISNPSRPKRTKRTITDEAVGAEADSRSIKAKKRTHAEEADELYYLQHLLQNPKSWLTTMDLSTIINARSFILLPEQSQLRLLKLLPPTAFTTFAPSIDPAHPSNSRNESPNHDLFERRTVDTLNNSAFTDSFLVCAMRTFQDHLFSGWETAAHNEKVLKFEHDINQSSVNAPWKDEEWIRGQNINNSNGPDANDLNSPTEFNLLVRKGHLSVGDIISYRRTFQNGELMIEKDLYIDAIHPRTSALNVIYSPGPVACLPDWAISRQPSEAPLKQRMADAARRSLSIVSAADIENLALETDGRVPALLRIPGNPWKCCKVWSWPTGPMYDLRDGKGGRKLKGTLFCLDAC